MTFHGRLCNTRSESVASSLKNVLITGSGGANGIGFTRSLRTAPEQFHLIGVDAGNYHILRSETDERYLVPRAEDPAYIPVLKSVIAETGADVVSVHQSAELVPISKNRDALGAAVMLPGHKSIETCDNKYLSYQAWDAAGLPVPRTILLDSENDLTKAFDELGSSIWIRSIVGSGGRDALPVDDYETALQWIDSKSGWGSFTAAVRLSPRSFTWESVWCDGELMVAQGRWRLLWEYGNRSPSGVTGITGVGKTGSSAELDAISEQAILAIDPKPHGIFSVDITLDMNGHPNLTEINCGRFFTTHQFFTELGLNLPYIFVKTALGERPPVFCRDINILPDDMVWIRGMDCEPILATTAEIQAGEAELSRRKSRLGIT